MDERAIARCLARMASEIVERARGTEQLVIVGIQRRGVELAARLKRLIDDAESSHIAFGKLDITLYRDDLQAVGPRPMVGETTLPELDDKTVVIVDDVLYTGRTIRAAMDALVDQGRPAAVRLAVLVDRGHRELPIRADHVGKNVPTSRDEVVHVRISEVDEIDEVVIERREVPVGVA